VTFEATREVVELEDGVVKTEHTELGRVVLSDEGSGRKGGTEEVRVFRRAVLVGRYDEENQ
jgi:hypothetical protein